MRTRRERRTTGAGPHWPRPTASGRRRPIPSDPRRGSHAPRRRAPGPRAAGMTPDRVSPDPTPGSASDPAFGCAPRPLRANSDSRDQAARRRHSTIRASWRETNRAPAMKRSRLREPASCVPRCSADGERASVVHQVLLLSGSPRAGLRLKHAHNPAMLFSGNLKSAVEIGHTWPPTQRARRRADATVFVEIQLHAGDLGPDDR